MTAEEKILNIRKLGRLPNPLAESDVKRLLQAGAIPKDALVPGERYQGICRNADSAVWSGKVFVYKRYKFGTTFDETINHFEDDNGYDLFIPVELIPYKYD